jgi:hypothetical protein
LEECLLAKGVANADAEEAVQSLRNIHELRHLKGHVAARKKADEARRALKAYGSFKAHFGMLAQGSDEALGAVLTAFRFHE